MIGICTDSSSQLPASLAERFGIEVVPLTVTVDDVEHLDGIDLDADAFYASYAEGRCPVVSSSQPSPGQFAAAYDDLAARGCTEILSIHVSPTVSPTINAARLAARALPMPVRVVDSGTAGFGVSCCVWAAASAIAQGATLDQAATVAGQMTQQIGNGFVIGAVDHVRAGAWASMFSGDGLPVLCLRDGAVEVLERVTNALEAVNALARRAIGWGEHLRVAIGHSDSSSEPLADALEAAIGETASVTEVLRYRIGPSIGVHTGPGTAGCFMFPAC